MIPWTPRQQSLLADIARTLSQAPCREEPMPTAVTTDPAALAARAESRHRQADALAEGLNDDRLAGPGCTAPLRGTCLQAESERAPSPAERERGMRRRLMGQYDPDRMCRSCRCYWLAECLVQELHVESCARRSEAGEDRPEIQQNKD